MEHITGILLYDSFIELPGSNKTFEEKQGHFQLPMARQAGRKEHATQCVASEDLTKFKGKSKENNCCWILKSLNCLRQLIRNAQRLKKMMY